MSLLTLSKETIDKIRTRAGIDEQRLKEAVKALKNWLKKQPHLPHDYGKYIYISSLIIYILHGFRYFVLSSNETTNSG
jgi:effector-binding domain-containing protein